MVSKQEKVIYIEWSLDVLIHQKHDGSLVFIVLFSNSKSTRKGRYYIVYACTYTYQYLLLILETYICTLPISSSMNKCIVVVVLLFALCATNVNVFLFSLMSMVDFCFPPICMGVCILGRISRITVIPCIFPLASAKWDLKMDFYIRLPQIIQVFLTYFLHQPHAKKFP